MFSGKIFVMTSGIKTVSEVFKEMDVDYTLAINLSD